MAYLDVPISIATFKRKKQNSTNIRSIDRVVKTILHFHFIIDKLKKQGEFMRKPKNSLNKEIKINIKNLKEMGIKDLKEYNISNLKEMNIKISKEGDVTE